MHYKCLACGKEIYDYPNPVETTTVNLKDSALINTVVITWVDHQEICDSCKADILRQIADWMECGAYEYGDCPSELRLLQ